MWTGISEAFVHIASVRNGRHWIFACWLALTVAAAVGGWFSGRSWIVVKNTPGEKTMTHLSRRNEAVLAVDSPKGQWTRRVKEATPADFPGLLEEWKSLFPETENGIEGQPEHALRWFYAEWLVRDSEGFVSHLKDGELSWFHPAAEIIARLSPELVIDLLREGEIRKNHACDLAYELATQHPSLYLSLNPDGSADFSPHISRGNGDDWGIAIRNLAKDDPMAAADAWKNRKLENNHDQVLQSLIPAFEAWKEGDPPIKDWVGRIEDPEIRELAQHARLMALARKDPHAALSDFYSTPLQINNDLREDGPHDVLAQLAKQDFPAALRLLKETSPLFGVPVDVSSPSRDLSDPFAETSPPSPTSTPSGPPPNPFVALASHEGDTPEDNWMRSVIVREAAGNLPENPDEMIAALHQLRTQMGGDSPWQRKIEAELIRVASERLSKESCFAIAQLWNTELGGGTDDDTYQSLAARSFVTGPDRAEAALSSLPEAARASFAAEIVKRLPPEETGRRLALLESITPAQWDGELGASLGEHAADYADAIAALPGETTRGARGAFMEKWVQNDPDAAIRWFDSLPMDDAAGPAALGLFEGWVDYDKAAAVAWAEALPAGPARQAVALEVVHEIAKNSPREAWRWAASITDPKVRAWAYNTISVSRDDEPEVFRKEHEAVLHAAGMK